MALICCLTRFVLLSFAVFFLPSESSLIKVSGVPQSHRAAGVFLLIEGGQYTLNFTAAKSACLFLNVTIATRAQVEQALQHGLETCKFGWITEQTGVIPRLTSDKNCGQGKTGVVTWNAEPDKKFGVFCFNASALATTAGPQSSTSSTTPRPRPPASSPAAPLVRTTTKTPPSTEESTTAKPPEHTTETSAFPLLTESTRTTRTPSSASPSLKPLSSHTPATLPHLITSKPRFVFSTSVHASDSLKKPSPRALLTALITLGIVLLLLSVSGVLWYYKLNIFACWSEGQQKDDTETEMWKHTDSEMDLHSQHGGEEDEEDDDDDVEESHRKYSSEITLCVNPHIKANSLES